MTETTGRPSTYSDEIAAEICEAIASSEVGLSTICAQNPHFPSPRTIYRWLDNERYDNFRQSYARAKAAQADNHADEIIAIADNTERDWEVVNDDNGNIIGVKVDGEHVQRSKLRIDARKWRAARLAPAKWGDRSDHMHTHSGTIETMSEESLDNAIAKHLGKTAAIGAVAGESEESEESAD